MSGHLAKYDVAVQDDPLAGVLLLAGWLRSDWRPLFASSHDASSATFVRAKRSVKLGATPKLL